MKSTNLKLTSDLTVDTKLAVKLAQYRDRQATSSRSTTRVDATLKGIIVSELLNHGAILFRKIERLAIAELRDAFSMDALLEAWMVIENYILNGGLGNTRQLA